MNSKIWKPYVRTAITRNLSQQEGPVEGSGKVGTPRARGEGKPDDGKLSRPVWGEGWGNTPVGRQEACALSLLYAWGPLAELCNQHLQKGALVYVAGRLETRSYEATDGQTRYVTDLVARDLVMLPRGDGHQSSGESAEAEEEETEELAEIPL